MPENSEISYFGEAAKWLESKAIKIWSKISINTDKGTFEGVLLPRGEQDDDKHIIIKLQNGYNVGFEIKKIKEIKLIEQLSIDFKIPKKTIVKNEKKPTVILFGTGGTVASKVDYRTGAVIPAFTPQELFNAIPELQEICTLQTKSLFQIFSENIEITHWITLAQEIVKYVEENNPIGIVIAHGTDTMHYTAAALSFMLKNVDRPIVLVGSQRSSDRPSSDAAINLISSVQIARFSDIAEVVVCMHGHSGDAFNLVHRGTRVRKMHTSRRDAFRTIGDVPLAKVENGKITPTGISYHKRLDIKEKISVDTKIDPNVGLIYFHPGMKNEIIDFYIEKKYSGLVIAGTGLGHVSQMLIKSLERAKEKNIPTFMTSQCLWGFTGLNVYETGRMLLKAGIIPLANMLPETALVKAMWVLGHTKNLAEIATIMQKNIAGEITERENYEGYLLFQGKVDSRIDRIIETEPK